MVACLVCSLLARPAVDRPRKQADYAALSHPANINTVQSPVELGRPVPLSHSG